VLFDHEVKAKDHEITNMTNTTYRFLPKGFSSPSAMDIFGDHVAIISEMTLGNFEKDVSTTVIVNQQIADSFRTWFKLLWKVSEKK
jgi:hypothetical protein